MGWLVGSLTFVIAWGASVFLVSAAMNWFLLPLIALFAVSIAAIVVGLRQRHDERR